MIIYCEGVISEMFLQTCFSMKMKERFDVTSKEENFDIKEYELIYSNNCTTIKLSSCNWYIILDISITFVFATLASRKLIWLHLRSDIKSLTQLNFFESQQFFSLIRVSIHPLLN